MAKLCCYYLIAALTLTIGASAGFTGWLPLGQSNWQILGTPSVVSITSDRLEVFVRNMGGGIGHIWHKEDRSWSDFADLGSPSGTCVLEGPVAKQIPNSGALFDVFITGCDRNVYHNYMNSDRSWSGWSRVGNAIGKIGYAPAVAVLGNGFEIFARHDEGYLIHTWKENGQYIDWQSWTDVQIPYGPAAETLDNGDIVVAALGPDRSMVVLVRSYATGTWTIRTTNHGAVAWGVSEIAISKLPPNAGVAKIWYLRAAELANFTVKSVNPTFEWTNNHFPPVPVSNSFYGSPVVAYHTDGRVAVLGRASVSQNLRVCDPGCNDGEGDAFFYNPAIGYVNGGWEVFVCGGDNKLKHGWWI